jgi:hypothetical protein
MAGVVVGLVCAPSERERWRVSPKAKKLKAALESNGYTNVKVWWEPMGIALEMCGNSGGYIFDSEEESEVPIGLSFDEAMKAVTEIYTRKHLVLNGLLTPASEAGGENE